MYYKPADVELEWIAVRLLHPIQAAITLVNFHQPSHTLAVHVTVEHSPELSQLLGTYVAAYSTTMKTIKAYVLDQLALPNHHTVVLKVGQQQVSGRQQVAPCFGLSRKRPR